MESKFDLQYAVCIDPSALLPFYITMPRVFLTMVNLNPGVKSFLRFLFLLSEGVPPIRLKIVV